MENTEQPTPADDQPIGAPHPQPEHEAVETSSQAKPTRKPMSFGKRLFIVSFLTVCAFGLYDTIFPSKNSLTLDELLPQIPSPSTVASPTKAVITPSPAISSTPTATASPTKAL